MVVAPRSDPYHDPIIREEIKMKTNKKTILIIALLALVSLMIIPVNAETLTGTLGTSSVLTNTVYNLANAGGSSTGNFTTIQILGIEYTKGLSAIIHYDATGDKMSFDSGAPSGMVSSFIAHHDNITGAVVGTGSWGYQRSFSALGVEQEGFQYINFDTWTGATALTGDQMIFLEYDEKSAYYPKSGSASATTLTTSNRIGVGKTFPVYAAVGAGQRAGDYSIVSNDGVLNTYTVIKPSGSGIAGSVVKSVSGTEYPSRVWIFNGTFPYLVITNEIANTNTTFSFTSPSSSIKIGIQSPNFGTWYNSSILFAPTVTPTPTTTWTDIDPIPSGYVRTWFINSDGATGGAIYGSHINLYDVENASWRNWSTLVNNLAYIDTLPTHTINAYGTATGYTGDTRLGLPAADTVYELILWAGLLAPGTGNVNLQIIVSGSPSGMAVPDVTLAIAQPSGAVEGGRTGETGTYVAVVPNTSLIRVTASKSGYSTVTSTITTSAAGPDTLRITLSRLSVIPTITATPLPGEVTVRPTTDPNDPSLHGGDTSLKAQEMMNWLAMNGMDLVQLCFLVTVLALLGVKFGK
jgi:hypothetical protein